MTDPLLSTDHLPRALADGDPQDEPGILLVDDHPFMLGVQKQLLEGVGYRRTGAAASATSALAMMRADPKAVDVLVCDLNMPGMDGIEFLQILNAEGFGGGVILLSGEGSRVLQTVQTLLGRGKLVILGALEKPAAAGALRDLIEGWKSTASPRAAQRQDPAFGEAELRAAHAGTEWTLHYQPKVALGDGSLASVEALLRWNHPTQGLVMPGRFIELAERCGLIDAMTTWALREALGQVGRWRDHGLHTRVAVNVSMASLEAPEFAQRVGDIVRETGMAPQDLILEVTESQLISSSAIPLENLVRLRIQRIGLSIDDFGTGHSSLAQLRDVPFTELKVDRGFVDGAHANPVTRSILEGSIGIARRLGMQSVAEGVETVEDWRLLQQLGCDLAQGYFVSRPLAADQLAAWHADWHGRFAALGA